MPVLEYLVAVMLGGWGIWIVDPVSQLGEHYFLGDLFHYDGPGFWFGIPIGSQLGFTLTTGILVGVLTWLMRGERSENADNLLANPRFGAMGGYVGQILFMAGTAFVVARTNSDPEIVRTADSLAGAAILMGLPAVLMTVVHWRSLAIAQRAEKSPIVLESPIDLEGDWVA